MAAPKRTKDQRELDLYLIMGLLHRGLHALDISRHLNSLQNRPYKLTRQQIEYDIKQIKKQWREENANLYDEYVGKEYSAINHLEKTYWMLWEQSLKNPPIQVEKRTAYKIKAGERKKGDRHIQDVDKHTKNPIGDIAYLQGVERCIKHLSTPCK